MQAAHDKSSRANARAAPLVLREVITTPKGMLVQLIWTAQKAKTHVQFSSICDSKIIRIKIEVLYYVLDNILFDAYNVWQIEQINVSGHIKHINSD
jgi:hypothetical protein